MVARHRPRLTWIARPTSACAARCRYRVGLVMPLSRMSSATSAPLVGGGAEREPERALPAWWSLVTVRGIARLVWVALGVAGSVDEVPRHRLGGGRAEADLAQEYEVAPRVVWHALATLAANRYVDRAGKFASYRVTWQPVK